MDNAYNKLRSALENIPAEVSSDTSLLAEQIYFATMIRFGREYSRIKTSLNHAINAQPFDAIDESRLSETLYATEADALYRKYQSFDNYVWVKNSNPITGAIYTHVDSGWNLILV